LGNAVRWRGLAAVYTAQEREAIAPLPVREQWFLHELKARFGGEIQPIDITVSLEPEPTPIYIDAEDIPFGDTPVRPQKRSYRLEWTNGTPTLHKTKKVATRRMRAWVNWKRRQGFQVITHPTGYFAGKDSVREAVQIREVPKEKAS
jgi:hypothetical protein